MTLNELFCAQQKNSWQQRTVSVDQRLETLKALRHWIKAHQKNISQALQKDFGKPEFETLMTEVYPVLEELDLALKNLSRWARPEKVPTPSLLFGTKSRIHYEAKGVVLIISPWNYPFNLAVIPLISAVAAGNCVMIKPSEFTPHTSQLLEEMVKTLFPANHVAVAQGDQSVATELLSLPFDHIFFTGSTAVGKIVMKAASSHLSSVTLELGGKSPTIVDGSADMEVAARKLIWGKFVNAGQTCIAPDYVFVQDTIYEDFLKTLKKTLQASYPANSKDLAGIVSPKHFQRLEQLLTDALKDGARVVAGGTFDAQKNSFAPTLLDHVSLSSAIMSEEIFGPLLPVFQFQDLSEVIHLIQSRPKPLALYMFSRSQESIQRVLKEISAGGVCVNDTLLHIANPHLPFGGVGPSGSGNYHGQNGFKTFSHAKSVLQQSWLGRMMKILYPPYSEKKLQWFEKFLEWKY